MKKDIHLSAYSIDSDTVIELERYGFERDAFINNTRCDITAYHGTYRGLLPERETLWDEVVTLLTSDMKFSGSLEQESFVDAEIVHFTGMGIDCKMIMPVPIGTGRDEACKLCDIHISIDIKESSADAIAAVSNMQVASFDKISNDREVRVFSITTNCINTGRMVFDFLASRLGSMNGLYGKMKFEATDRIYRFPKDAPMLPLSRMEALQKWVQESGS
jgi:hypothetical protein